KLQEQKEASTRMVELWRHTVDKAVALARHDALWRAHSQLQGGLGALVQEHAREKEWTKQCCSASDVDGECYACSGPSEVEGGDVWGRAFCYERVEWCRERPPRVSCEGEELVGD
ncbi:MAG: hypothetical protein ACKPKO_00400, partial [Candidatus Fonsibacter sp.]